ncbi:fimbrial protein [Achromobacter pestifer]
MRTTQTAAIGLILLAAGYACIPSPSRAQSSGDNLTFSGRLAAEACTLSPESEQVQLNLFSVPDRTLYLDGRTPGRPITLHLLDCDISEGNSLSIYFDGPESDKLPGLLALDSDGISGVAIGLETHQGVPLPLKKQNAISQLVDGANDIQFMAYLQAEKEAIENHKIGRGEIKNATLTFTLSYD